MKKILVIVLLMISFVSYGQIDRTFWFAVPKENSHHGYFSTKNTISFKITAMDLDATVTVSMPLNDIPLGTFNPNKYGPQTFTVPAHQSYIYTMAMGDQSQTTRDSLFGPGSGIEGYLNEPSGWTDFVTFYNSKTLLQNRDSSDQPGSPENRGFLITSDNDITVYYDYDNYWNRELFVLKGQNALGKEFYTPFQNIWGSDNTGKNGNFIGWQPYCSIEIVATVDNTLVKIIPPALAIPVFNGYANNDTITVTLNRGQTFSLAAQSQLSFYHPTGTHIISNQPIAVTQNDDSQEVNAASCMDINGDQLVPDSILGSKYLVMSGSLSINPPPVTGFGNPHNNQKGEQVFVPGN